MSGQLRSAGKKLALLLPLTLVAAQPQGCQLMQFLQPSSSNSNQNVYKPTSASQSPNMDFTKIDKLGIFPLFSTGNIQNQGFAEGLVSSMTSEIQENQSQWDIMNYRDVLRGINEHDLGKGYKNLQADINTYSVGSSGGFVLSSATEAFLGNLQDSTECDSFLIGSYKISEERVRKHNAFTDEYYYDTTTVCKATLTLIRAESSERWWTATWSVSGSPDAIKKAIGESAGSNLGKGTLRQL